MTAPRPKVYLNGLRMRPGEHNDFEWRDGVDKPVFLINLKRLDSVILDTNGEEEYPLPEECVAECPGAWCNGKSLVQAQGRPQCDWCQWKNLDLRLSDLRKELEQCQKRADELNKAAPYLAAGPEALRSLVNKVFHDAQKSAKDNLDQYTKYVREAEEQLMAMTKPKDPMAKEGA